MLPIAGDGPGGVLPGVLLAGFANLILVAAVAPLAGRRLRRRRPDLPRVVADNYAGTALLLAFAAAVARGRPDPPAGGGRGARTTCARRPPPCTTT